MKKNVTNRTPNVLKYIRFLFYNLGNNHLKTNQSILKIGDGEA